MKTYQIVQTDANLSQVNVYCDSFIVFNGTVIFLSFYGTTVAVKSITAQIINNRGGIYLIDPTGQYFSPDEKDIELKRNSTRLMHIGKNIKPGITQKILFSENLFFPWKNGNSRFLAFGETEKDAISRGFAVIDKMTTVPLKISWKNWLWERLQENADTPMIQSNLKEFGYCKILDMPSDEDLEAEIIENLELLKTI